MMQSPEDEIVSSEDFARLIEGEGDPDRLDALRLRISASPRLLAEFLRAAEGAEDAPGMVSSFEIDRRVSQVFPAAAAPLRGFRERIRDALESMRDAGWTEHAPAFRDAAAAEGLAFGKSLAGWMIGLRLDPPPAMRSPSPAQGEWVDVTITVRPDARAVPADAVVKLTREGTLIASLPLEGDQAIFRRIAPGEYEVAIGEGIRFPLRLA